MESTFDLFADTLMSTAEVYRVGHDSSLYAASECGSIYYELACTAVHGRSPVLARQESLASDVAAAIAMPVFRDTTCTSVVVLALKASAAAGVIEIWKPTQRYAEMALADGFYGVLERFHNVSSFVRFERGMGLPGQTWELNHAVIHDDLPNHPGFLRAAGASAGSLSSAVGIPVTSDEFIASVVLINSNELPIARGMQSWVVQGDAFDLPMSSSVGVSSIDKAEVRCRASSDVNWLRHSIETGEALWRVDDSSHVCVAIPSFRGAEPRGVLVLCF